MQLFYNPDLHEDSEVFSFGKEESHHISKVLRKKTGDNIHITNGKGFLFEGVIQEIAPKACTVEITDCYEKKLRNYYLHMVVAPTKINDRYEWFLEKATEIGVDEITPIICEHSERKTIKKERFEKVLIAAMKQSLQTVLPKLNDAIAVNDFLKQEQNGQLFIAHCQPTPKHTLKLKVKQETDVTILIGPEGDFTNEEIEMALEQNFEPITLGRNRLRTETAAIIACSQISFYNQ